MEGLINSGEAKPMGSMEKELVDLICEGLEKSKYTAGKILEFYKMAVFK